MRAPPAFQEYASDMLTSECFRTASLAERGLLYTLRLECWRNGSLPAEPMKLGQMLQLDPDIIFAALNGIFKHLFTKDDATGRIICPELVEYRTKLDERHEKKAAAGRKGADLRWHEDGIANSTAKGAANGTANGSLSKDERKKEEKSKSESTETSTCSLTQQQENQEWAREYERVESVGGT